MRLNPRQFFCFFSFLTNVFEISASLTDSGSTVMSVWSTVLVPLPWRLGILELLRDVNNPILKEILSRGSTSVAACIVVYSFVTPLLEEMVYRGFLLTSLASTMKWPQAVVVSSAVFSAAHFSGENSIQLFIIGSILGCSYCWTGNLGSSIVIHSLYNALTLLVTFMS
ncbi:hypothetical protein RJ639_027731 [Escallonia herrerae]|uniref:CAAX prenyl protease 2/Lysostaphin resistance protein A-like domain-containing protein n=1 Tax=Escallonia herrerae TaxID=1293975 RepID=A0AA89BK76_9ASTE|nr:hypothetical protein RJ639_027731 [Escallonia herrerae]